MSLAVEPARRIEPQIREVRQSPTQASYGNNGSELEFPEENTLKRGRLMRVCKPSTWKVETRGRISASRPGQTT